MRAIPLLAVASIFCSAAALHAQEEGMGATDARQQSAAKTFAAKPVVVPKPVAAKPGSAKTGMIKAAPLVPLTDREKALQMLDRFTFGPRPGDVDAVLAMGPGKWLEAQMAPDSIPNGAMDRRLGDFPTLNMTADQALLLFPDRGAIGQIADGKKPYPADPLLAAMYEVQVTKYTRQIDNRKPDKDGNVPQPSQAEIDAQKKMGQATALRIAGELFTLPKNQRMIALTRMPVDDRIAFTSYVGGDQKNLLFADFTPREREIFLGMQSDTNAAYRIGEELSQAKMVRAILSERQLQEVMTDFWFNHFNVYIQKDSDQWYTTSYERDVIRKNALGKFSDLLLATAQSPAMMVYLDNWLSIGPDSQANGVDPKNPRSKPGNKGLNENYGREIMELQTVGVNGGYTQSDVTNLAAVLTGWTVDRPYQAGPFLFDPRRHEPGTKTWLGHTIGGGPAFVIQGTTGTPKPAKAAPSMDMAMSMGEMGMGGASPAEQKAVATASAPGNEGMKEGLEALNLLARSPQTAHFISWKIAQRFVADEPPAALVDQMAKTFLASDGDIKAVLRTLVASPEFNSKLYFRNKVKTPMEFLASAYRTTMTDPSNPQALVGAMRNMGMPLYLALAPTGYYITADQWMSTSALVNRLNFAYQLTNSKFANQKFDAPKVLALGLLSQHGMPTMTASAAAAPALGPVKPKSGFTEAAMVSSAPARATPTTTTPAGTEIALKVLETTLIGGDVSAQTNSLIHKQVDIANQQNQAANDMLNLLTALVMGSPEFQLR